MRSSATLAGAEVLRRQRRQSLPETLFEPQVLAVNAQGVFQFALPPSS